MLAQDANHPVTPSPTPSPAQRLAITAQYGVPTLMPLHPMMLWECSWLIFRIWQSAIIQPELVAIDLRPLSTTNVSTVRTRPIEHSSWLAMMRCISFCFRPRIGWPIWSRSLIRHRYAHRHGLLAEEQRWLNTIALLLSLYWHFCLHCPSTKIAVQLWRRFRSISLHGTN